MRDIVLLLISTALILGLVGYLTGNDIQSCIDKGNSAEDCYNAFGR